MYERFYQLRNRPFALSPDPDFLYPSRVHREALDYLRFGIEGHAGFVVVTGEIGSGKTTLLQVLLRSLDGQTTVIRIVNTLLTGAELLEAMLLDLGVKSLPMSKPAMVRELARLLISERAHGRRVVAIIDEAQNLSLAALEELRMLSNLETEKSKLIQIVLVGQPDLRTSLDLPSLEQLRQRVTVRYHLGPLDAGGDGRIHQPPARSRRRSRAARVLARRDGSRARAQRRYAAHDQRHLRRGTARGLCRERAGHRRAADADGHLGAGSVYGPAAQGRHGARGNSRTGRACHRTQAHLRSATHPTRLSAHRAGGSGCNRRCGRRAGCAARHASAAAVGGT